MSMRLSAALLATFLSLGAFPLEASAAGKKHGNSSSSKAKLNSNKRAQAASGEMAGAQLDDPKTEEEAALETIREYEINDVSVIGTEPEKSSSERSMAEIVNPFSAQRNGHFHGAFYHFHRNDNLDARNFFDPVGEPLPEYKRNQFGVNVAAALRHNVHFMGTYEGLRIIQGSTLVSHVPTSAMKQGDFSASGGQLMDPLTAEPFTNSQIPQERIHPVASRLLPLLPDPNQSDPDRNFINDQPIVRNRDSVSFKVDFEIDEGSKTFVEYSLGQSDNVLVHPLPAFGSDAQGRDQRASVSYTRTLSSSLIMSFDVRFSRNADVRESQNAGREGLLSSLGIGDLEASVPEDEGYPEFQLSGYSGFGDRISTSGSVRNSYSADGSLTYVMQDHRFGLGLDWDIHQINDDRTGELRRGRFGFNGYYTGDAFADFLLGLPDTAYRAVGTDRTDLRRRSWRVWARDNWRINPQLSANFGLTYDFTPPYHSTRENVSTFYPLLFEPPADGEIVLVGSDRARQLGLDAGDHGLIFPDLNNWAPQLGLAYSPWGSPRSVIRASYSIDYVRPGSGYFIDYLTRNYPFYFIESAQAPPDDPTLDLSSPFQSPAAAELTIRGIEPHIKAAYVQRWQLSVENQVFQHWNLEASYAGQKGTHWWRRLPANVPLPGPGPIQPRRPNPDFGRFNILSAGGSYSEHELDVGAERRLADGLSLRSGFEWSRYLSDLYGGDPSNPRDLRAERAPSDWRPTRSFYLNYIIDLPSGPAETVPWGDWLLEGWRLSGITRIQDGGRYHASLKGDPNNDGVTGDRPDRLGSGVLDSSAQSVDQWFDIGDFTLPDEYGFGDSGRNILKGPSYQNWDISLVKRTSVADGHLVEFRLELFNAFNHVNFNRPYAEYGNSLFGKIFGADRAREIELALKYSF